MIPAGLSIGFVAYILVFAIASAGCLGALLRARQIEDPDTRRGLMGLLVGSGGWAIAELGFLLAPSATMAYALYDASLVIGLTTIGAWLYFTSAYTGRAFHHNSRYRWAAVAVYLAIVGVKLTNPIHNLYFTTELVSTPFPHLTIRHGIIHWIVTGFSYTLVAIGFFMLYELFLEADYDTRPLAAIVAVTGLPVVFDIVGFASPLLIDINYEPLGVVLFALGMLYITEDRFLAVQLTDGVDDAVIYLDKNDRIREFNDDATEIFPSLPGSIGDPIATVLPDVESILDADEQILQQHHDGRANEFYLINDTRFDLGQTTIGRMIVVTDVTESERRRRELDRHNDQLDGFARAFRHELYNTLHIITGHVDIAGNALDEGNVQQARDALRTISETTNRMSAVTEDFVDLAKYGQTIENTEAVDFESIVRSAFGSVTTDELTLSVDGGGTIDANESRLYELFESAFEFALENNATNVTVRLASNELIIIDDGDPVGDTEPTEYFAYDAAVPNAKAGLALPTLKTLAEIHGWEPTIDTAYTDGIRIRIRGVTTQTNSKGREAETEHDRSGALTDASAGTVTER